MFDMHYDLLTFIYMASKNKKDIDALLKPFNQDNIIGVSANLYFMSKKEMALELDYNKQINVLEMFKTAKSLLEKRINHNVIYSIEGSGYIKNLKELEELYKHGLDAILLTWNNKNKYGSGSRTNRGLTRKGKKFIRKALDLGLAIDLSHANEKTFKGIIKEIKKVKNPICYASHSNIDELYHHPRNLTNEQLYALKEVGGMLGLVAYPLFLTDSNDNQKIRKAYTDHIKKAVAIMGVDNVMLASDNMEYLLEFDQPFTSQKSPYNYEKINKQIYNDLKPYFKDEEIKKIMFENALRLYKRIKKQRGNKGAH